MQSSTTATPHRLDKCLHMLSGTGVCMQEALLRQLAPGRAERPTYITAQPLVPVRLTDSMLVMLHLLDMAGPEVFSSNGCMHSPAVHVCLLSGQGLVDMRAYTCLLA